jgi:hypothetical protein
MEDEAVKAWLDCHGGGPRDLISISHRQVFGNLARDLGGDGTLSKWYFLITG